MEGGKELLEEQQHFFLTNEYIISMKYEAETNLAMADWCIKHESCKQNLLLG